ncbi:hypothetical protein PR202_gb13469 [Eleusine coracana subsp. coracana]|uniref:F-box domain-containing protein n=1 Tax=Eleusine coracana subsp. coracana TaxID=191504 RepID=A0AAV5EU70_ELECO|nr:hypothetical protein PR202_gb13469 [Eleusine coracana subsp. coracana]
MAAALSDLPDDLLRHVLSLTPAKEAASTAVLSRRWRSLWRTCGAVNIDSRSYGSSAEARESFVRGVKAALDASRPIRKLTIHVELDAETYAEVNKRYRSLNKPDLNLVDAVVSHPAARGVEVIHVGAHRILGFGFVQQGFHTLSYGALPSEALAVLHITNCFLRFTPPPGTTTFPLLAELRLHGCSLSVMGLQAVINVSPKLATLHLQHISFYYSDDDDGEEEEEEQGVTCYRLRCPSVTALVLKNCSWVKGCMELDVPRLRCLTFKGPVRSGLVDGQVSLKVKSQEQLDLLLDRVDVHLTDDNIGTSRSENNKIRVPFWQSLRNFSKAKVLKLKLDYPIDQVAVVHKKDQDHQLHCNDAMFGNLTRLELEGSFVDAPAGKVAAAAAIANLLHCCPVLRDLRLNLRKALRSPSITRSDFRLVSLGRARLDFDESVEHFKHCRRNSLATDDGQHDFDTYDEVSDIPGLTGHSFKCLQSCLRRVTLQLRMKNNDPADCFGTQLAKFFSTDAMALEELYIDDGIHRICEHMNLVKIGRWAATNSPKKGKPATGGITVLPHET